VTAERLSGQATVVDGGGGPPPLAGVLEDLAHGGGLGQDVEVSAADGVVQVRRRDAAVVVLETAALAGGVLDAWVERLCEGRAGLLVLGEPVVDPSERLSTKVAWAAVGAAPGRHELTTAVAGMLERVDLRLRAERTSRRLDRYEYELGELVEIARALTQERDIHRLLSLILEKSRFITGADAGSIYVIEAPRGGASERTLRFKLSQNESCTFESAEFTMPVSTRSIAGNAVITRRALNIPDVYTLPADAPYGFDASFDRRVGYRTRSMLAVPMVSAEDEVIGVIQLINKKRDARKRLTEPEHFEDEVVAFDARSEELLATLASQAGIALENAQLYDEIKRIFEGFVLASVEAIEQRDPTTSGHSVRVSMLSCRLAEVVDRADSGPFAGTTFTRRDLKELEYASLLHDFGKIGVREQVLVKAKKLYPHTLDDVRARIHYAVKSAEAEVLARKLELMRAGAGASDLARLDEHLVRRRTELEEAWKTVVEANEPTVLSEGEFSRIAEIGQLTFVDGDGQVRPLLTAAEVESLQVTRGSLSVAEMDEIRSHVVHSYNFLSRIPWGKSYANVPLIAGAHHEKLNGTGYPGRLAGDAIPLPSKIMTIADIYDALTARDRPYKKAVPTERALTILGFEVEANHVDGELVRIFREAEVFRAVDGLAD
jgi:HD-GYP domain-containing protein (c-di-GMP phosphodiesterase class II)